MENEWRYVPARGELRRESEEVFELVIDKEQTMDMIRLQYLGSGATSARHETGRRGSICRVGVALLGAALLILVIAPLVEAVPKRIIILRHGEKHDGYELCSVGQQRSLALKMSYLGKGAFNSLFPRGTRPAGIFAATLHCLELASPAAQSWGMPLQLYSVVPLSGQTKAEETLLLNKRTREAAKAVLKDPRWNGKIVVMVWEHDHIARESLEEEFPNEKVTLRQLLNLDKLPNVPQDWPGGNFDYFWIVDYGYTGSAIPTNFTMKQQEFQAPYDTVPSNAWDTPEDLPEGSGCEL